MNTTEQQKREPNREPETDPFASNAQAAVLGDVSPPRPQELFELTGRVAVVTGGATHLGRAMTSALAGSGAIVYIAARDGDRCRVVADKFAAAGADVRGRTCDIADPEAIVDLMDGIASNHGRLDIAVCNAAARSKGGFMEMGTDALRQNLDVNILGTALCARAAARHMLSRHSGSIVLIGSTHGALGSDRRTYAPGFQGSAADYHIAKGAIINMARALAMEWSTEGVRVNCLSPGQIPQPSLPIEQLEYFRSSIPLGILGRPEDLMGTVLLLASDAGRFITGQNLIVDGGASAW